MGQGKRIVEFAKAGNLTGGVTELKRQAHERGHGQQTALAGAGGLMGAVLGSFRGPLGAAFGALLGAFLGALFGRGRDQRVAVPTGSVRRPQESITRQEAAGGIDDGLYVDAIYQD